MKYLIVEDNEIANVLYDAYFQKIGMNPDKDYIIVTTGNEALDIFKSQHIRFVVLDSQLPDINGHDLAQQMLKIHKASIVMISAGCTIDEKKKALDIGCVNFLCKPVTFKQFSEALQML